MKSVCIHRFSGPSLPAFRLNTRRYFVSLRIQSECGKIRTRKTPNTDTFYYGHFISRKLIRLKISAMPLKLRKMYYMQLEQMNFAIKMSHVNLSSSYFNHIQLRCVFQIFATVWLNGGVLIYELSGCGFESRCCHLNFRNHACFEQGLT